MTVANLRGNVDAYAPAVGEPADTFTVTEMAKDPDAVQTAILVNDTKLTLCNRARVHDRWRDQVLPFFLKALATEKATATLCARPTLTPVDYIVRVPRQARAEISTVSGSVHVTDVSGPVDVRVRNGDIKLQIPSYGDASTQNGSIVAIFGDAHWPGTLHFSTERGDVEVWVPATADASVDLHTDRGTIFTDFELRGSSNQAGETIVGSIGKGGQRRVNVRVTNGSIRLLKLTPQM